MLLHVQDGGGLAGMTKLVQILQQTGQLLLASICN